MIDLNIICNVFIAIFLYKIIFNIFIPFILGRLFKDKAIKEKKKSFQDRVNEMKAAQGINTNQQTTI